MRRKVSVEYLPFRALLFDERAQRAVIPARVKKLLRDWNLEHVGTITVSIRDRKALVIDGQHRVRAAMELGLGDTQARCDVYRGLTVAEEARKFLALNDSRLVSSLDKYFVGLTAKDPTALAVREIHEKHGLDIGGSTRDGVVSCVATVTALAESDPRLLDDALTVVVEAWGTRSAALEHIVLRAIGTVLARYNGELDLAALAKKLAKYRGGPAALAGDARGLSDFRPISVTRAASEIIIETYNKGRGSGRLSPL